MTNEAAGTDFSLDPLESRLSWWKEWAGKGSNLRPRDYEWAQWRAWKEDGSGVYAAQQGLYRLAAFAAVRRFSLIFVVAVTKR